MHTASTWVEIQSFTGLLCLVTVAKLRLDHHVSGEGFSEWSADRRYLFDERLNRQNWFQLAFHAVTLLFYHALLHCY